MVHCVTGASSVNLTTGDPGCSVGSTFTEPESDVNGLASSP